MALRYWLALLCVALPLCAPSEAYNRQLYGHTAGSSSGGVWAQLGWPALPDFRRPAYTRPYHSFSRRLYPKWPLTATGETYNHYAGWPRARPAPGPSQHRVHHHEADQHHAGPSWTDHSVRPYQSSNTVQVSHTVDRPQQTSHAMHRPYQASNDVDSVPVQPAPSTRDDTGAAALPVTSHITGRRQSHQWVLPRRFLISTDSERGRGPVQACQDGKVWQNGRCECPYLSNWNEDTNSCECVYGTYRHSSGNCHSYW